MAAISKRPPFFRFSPQNDDTVRITWSLTDPEADNWDSLDFWVVGFDQVVDLGQLVEMTLPR